MSEIFGIGIMGGGSGSGGTLTVTGVAGHTVTATKDGKTYTRTFNSSGVAVFKGLETGTWTVTIKKDGLTATQQIEIDTDYELTMAYFTATIAVTFPTDSTSVTCTKGDTVLSVPSGSLSSGSYTFAIPKAGEWTLYATNGTKEKSVTVNVTEEKAYSAKLTFELVLFDNGTTDDVVGGWDITTASDSSYFNVGVNSNIYLASKSSIGNGAAIFSNNKVSMDGYSKLCFRYKVTSLGNEYSRFGLTNTITGVKDLKIVAVYNVTSTDSNFRTAEISISNLQSLYHLYFGVRFYGNLYVNRVWLE